MAYTTTSATGAGDSRKNSTNYEHPQETNLLNIHKAMQYNVLGEPILRTTLGPTASDAFGRFRTSEPFTLFDSFHRYQDNGKAGTFTATGGTSTHDANASAISCTVTTASGSSVTRESLRVMAYQPGKSLLILQTFVMAPAQANVTQRIGYFDADNGMYLEQEGTSIYFVRRSRSTSGNGSMTTTRVAKTDWNVTPLDGTGADKITLNLATAQIMFTEIEWLGVGSVRQGFVINGQFIPCHQWNHANETGSTSTYMTTACLPVRAEIFNTGTTAANSTMKVICTSVISEGGYELRGHTRAIGHEITAPRTTIQAQVNTLIPMISIRLKTTRTGAVVIPTNFSFAPITSASYQYYIIGGAITSGGTWESAGDNSSVEYNLTPTAFTANGTVLDQGYVLATNQSSVTPDLQQYPFKFQLERNTLTSPVTCYEFVIATRTTTNQTSQCIALGWEEIT